MNGRLLAVPICLLALGTFVGCAPASGRAPERAATSGAADRSGTPSPVPTAPTATAPVTTPLGAGERVWAAFSHRGLAYDAWWAQLAPLLSEAARAVYVYDDPRNLPPMTLTGEIHLAARPPAEARYTAEVLVPTSKGLFRLDLERHRIGSPWLLYAIRFPPGVR